MARFVDGRPSEVFLDVPALNQRFVALRGRGATRNNQPLTSETRALATSACVSLCSRSIRVLQRKPDQRFPGKIRLLGVASLNLVSVAMGQTIASLEATPKIWDLAAAWLVLDELGCPIRWLDADPAQLSPGEDVADLGFPCVGGRFMGSFGAFSPLGRGPGAALKGLYCDSGGCGVMVLSCAGAERRARKPKRLRRKS